jgi:hypothetical protein
VHSSFNASAQKATFMAKENRRDNPRSKRRGICVSCSGERSVEWYRVRFQGMLIAHFSDLVSSTEFDVFFFCFFGGGGVCFSLAGQSVFVTLADGEDKLANVRVENPSATTMCESCVRRAFRDNDGSDWDEASLLERLDDVLQGCNAFRIAILSFFCFFALSYLLCSLRSLCCAIPIFLVRIFFFSHFYLLLIDFLVDLLWL